MPGRRAEGGLARRESGDANRAKATVNALRGRICVLRAICDLSRVLVSSLVTILSSFPRNRQQPRLSVLSLQRPCSAGI